MSKDLCQIEFYFPEQNLGSQLKMVDSIISLMKDKGSIGYSGYADIELLKQGLLDHIGSGNIEGYKKISEKQKSDIEKVISETIEKCNSILPVPTKNFIFVHPYFSTDQDDKDFGGVMGVAVYSCVFHVFVNFSKYTKQSLENTIAHELNHTIYYYHHYDNLNNYTLLDEILLEGLAENFREQYFNPETATWAGALKKDEAFQILRSLDKDTLESRDQNIIRGFLFGNDKYKKWTGYSTGYWLAKEFMNTNKNLSWDDLMKTNPEEFMRVLK